MQTRRAKSPKRAQGFNLILLLESVGFTEGNWQVASNICPEQLLQIISQECLGVGTSLLFWRSAIWYKQRQQTDSSFAFYFATT